MVSTSELTVVVFANTTDLVRFPLLFFASAIWVVAWNWESSLLSAACAVVQRHWMVPYATWREPHCHSPPSSQRHTHQQEEVAPPAHLPHLGSCSCAGPRQEAAPGTSRCSSREPSSPSWRPCAGQTELGRIAPSTRRLDGPGPEVETDGYRGASQPLRLKLLRVV
jgi:hypothetical protein